MGFLSWLQTALDNITDSLDKQCEKEYESVNRLSKRKISEEHRNIPTEPYELQSDSVLMNKYKSQSITESERQLIQDELYSRGYYKNSKGNWDRRGIS